jgi:hypothetical protein
LPAARAAVDVAGARARRIHAALEAGSVTRAAAALEQEPLEPWSREMHEKLQALHPEEPEQPAAPGEAAPPALVTMEQLGAVLRGLKKGKAAGPSGTTYEHLTAAVTGSEEGMAVLLELANLMLSGSLPHCPELTDCRLVAVRKPNDGVRPIAIGEVLVRIASLCALAACPGAGADLAPLQLGVGVSGGSEAMGHALRAAIAAEPDAVLAQVDFENAFNTPLRSELISAARVRTPALERYVTWLYGRHARLFVEGAPPGEAPILSQRGVRQGDPLGPLLFANLLQGPLEQAIAAAPSTKSCAVHDDAVLQGTPDDVRASLEKLQELTAPLGMRVRQDKCAVYSPRAELAAALARDLGMRHAVDGIVAAGSPVGSDSFVRAYVERRVDIVRGVVARLRELVGHLSPQDGFLLLRCSISSRLTFLQRVVPATAPLAPDDPILAAHQAAAADIADAALEFAQLKDRATPASAVAQLQAPLRDGGFGMYSCREDEPAAAYLSSAALAQRALQHAPAALQPFGGPMRAALQDIWGALRARFPTIEAMGGAVLDDATICGELPALQHNLARHAADRAAAAALAAAPREMQATLRSAGCHPASAWLMAKPTAPQLTQRSSDFCAGVRRRLGVSALPTGPRHARCACNKPACELGSGHPLSCSSVSGLRTTRHDDIAKALARAMRRAGITATVEPHLSQFGGVPTAAQLARRRARTDNGTDDARGDIVCFIEGENVVIDVSVINALAPSHVVAAAAQDGAAAAKRDEQKRAAYADRGDSGYKFIPFSVESLGRLGAPALSLLTKLGRTAAEASAGAFSSRQFVEGVLQEISVILAHYNRRMEVAVAGYVLRPAGREYMRAHVFPSCDVGDGM